MNKIFSKKIFLSLFSCEINISLNSILVTLSNKEECHPTQAIGNHFTILRQLLPNSSSELESGAYNLPSSFSTTSKKWPKAKRRSNKYVVTTLLFHQNAYYIIR